MSDQLGHTIVMTVFASRVGYVSNERNVTSNVPPHVKSSLYICVIMLEMLIFSVNSLSQCFFEEVREHKHDKVKYILLLIVMVQVKEIKGQYFLQHIVKKIVIVSFIESGLYLYLKITDTNESHNIASTDTHFLGISSIENAHDR